MEAFAYAHPTTKQQALGMLGPDWDSAAVLAGGTDLISLMKEHVVIPKRVVSIRGVQEWSGITATQRNAHRRARHFSGFARSSHAEGSSAVADDRRRRASRARRFATWARLAAICASARAAGISATDYGLLARDPKGKALVPEGENRYHAIFGNSGPAYFVNPSSLAPALIALGANVKIAGPKGERETKLVEFFVIPKSDTRSGECLAARRNRHGNSDSRPAAHRMAEQHLRGPSKEALDWPLATASVALQMDGGQVGRRLCSGTLLRCHGLLTAAAQRPDRQEHHPGNGRRCR